jgi:hypothetical protein
MAPCSINDIDKNSLFVRLTFHEFCEMKFSGRTCLPVYPPVAGRQTMPLKAGARVNTQPLEAVLINPNEDNPVCLSLAP